MKMMKGRSGSFSYMLPGIFFCCLVVWYGSHFIHKTVAMFVIERNNNCPIGLYRHVG